MIYAKEQFSIYRTFGILSLLATVWVVWNMVSSVETPVVCLFRNATDIPCPSCGITHSVMAILHMQFSEAVRANPLGYVAMLLLLVVPPLILVDLVFRKTYFISLYRWSENQIKQRLIISIPLTMLLVANWVMLIFKG